MAVGVCHRRHLRLLWICKCSILEWYILLIPWPLGIRLIYICLRPQPAALGLGHIYIRQIPQSWPWYNYYIILPHLSTITSALHFEGSVTSENRVRDLKSQWFFCDFMILGVISWFQFWFRGCQWLVFFSHNKLTSKHYCLWWHNAITKPYNQSLWMLVSAFSKGRGLPKICCFMTSPFTEIYDV